MSPRALAVVLFFALAGGARRAPAQPAENAKSLKVLFIGNAGPLLDPMVVSAAARAPRHEEDAGEAEARPSLTTR